MWESRDVNFPDLGRRRRRRRQSGKGRRKNFFVLAAMPEDKHVERIREVRQVLRSENLTNEVAAHFWFPRIQSAPKNSVPEKYDFYRFFS